MSFWLPIDGWRDALDIALVAIFGWLAIGFVRRTRARRAIAGVAVLGAVYFVARGLELRLSESLFQGFFAVLVIVLVVVFQEDLRRFFEQLGSWRPRADRRPASDPVLDALVRTVARMASTRTGALIVLPGREPLERHLEGGITLGGRVSEPLLLSIFDSSSPGHDGAVLLREGAIERFAIHLPLSSNHEAIGPGGTRHAAALGLSEQCDALCVVVSEERGTVSVAKDGELKRLARAEDLGPLLRAHLPSSTDQPSWWRGQAALDAAMAALGAVALWMVVVPGSDVAITTVPVPVDVVNLPSDLALEKVDPPEVQVTLRGLRRNLMFGQIDDVAVEIDAYLSRLGRRTFSVSPQEVRKPDTLDVVNVEPERVRLSVRNLASETAP